MKYYLLPVLFFGLFACNNRSAENAETVAPSSGDVLPEGFAEFYQRFHQDSAWQMAHITFPLEGLPDNAGEEVIRSGNFRWQKKDWKIMQPVDYQMSEFRRDFIPLTDKMVVERIIHKSGQFGMVRRFAVIAGEWHLIYYAGMNRLAQ